jgi:single-strand DNA-binding protein
MAYLNKVMLMGNMGKDAEIRVTTQGRKKAAFSLATTRRYRDQASGETREQTDWHNIVAWGPMAERIEKLRLAKGTALYVEGRLGYRDYTDQGGAQRRVCEVTVDAFEFLVPRGAAWHEASQEGPDRRQEAPRYEPPPPPGSPAPRTFDPDEDGIDMPF